MADKIRVDDHVRVPGIGYGVVTKVGKAGAATTVSVRRDDTGQTVTVGASRVRVL